MLRFVGAIGASAGMVIARAVVRDLAEGTRGAILMSRLVLVMGVAPILAPSLGAAFLTFASWRFIFWFQAVYGASCALLAWRVLPETLPEARRIKVGVAQILTRYGSILREPVFRAHALMGMATTFCMFAVSRRIVAGVHPGVRADAVAVRADFRVVFLRADRRIADQRAAAAAVRVCRSCCG